VGLIGELIPAETWSLQAKTNFVPRSYLTGNVKTFTADPFFDMTEQARWRWSYRHGRAQNCQETITRFHDVVLLTIKRDKHDYKRTSSLEWSRLGFHVIKLTLQHSIVTWPTFKSLRMYKNFSHNSCHSVSTTLSCRN